MWTLRLAHYNTCIGAAANPQHTTRTGAHSYHVDDR